jgi:hypothetical protein
MRKTEDQPTDNASYNGSTGSGKETAKRSRHAPENLSTTGAYRQEINVVDASRPLQSIGDPISYQNDGKCSAAIVGKVEIT